MKTREKNKYTSSNNSSQNWDGIPAVVNESTQGFFSRRHFVFSIGFHVIIAVICCIIAVTIGLNPDFKKKTKVKDIEFVLSNSSYQKPKVEKTTTGADTQKPVIEQNMQPQTDIKPPQPAKQTTKTPTKHSNNNTSQDVIPDDFSLPMPHVKPLQSALGSGRSSTSSRSNSYTTPSSGADNGNETASDGNSNRGTTFDKNTTRKVITSYDISPYVNELKRNIQWNWKAPKSDSNNDVELFLRIARDGKIIILNVKKTSESAEIDNAALNAVRKASPLNPLPAKFSKNYLDLVFVFDSSSHSLRSRY